MVGSSDGQSLAVGADLEHMLQCLDRKCSMLDTVGIIVAAPTRPRAYYADDVAAIVEDWSATVASSCREINMRVTSPEELAYEDNRPSRVPDAIAGVPIRTPEYSYPLPDMKQ